MAKLIKILFIFIIFIFIISAAGFVVASSYYNKEVTKAGTNSTSQELTVQSGESVNEIANDLQSKNIIDNPFIFSLYLKINQFDKQVEAGKYVIGPHATIKDIAQTLQKGNFYKSITIREGLRIEEQADIIDQSLAGPDKQFNKGEFIQLAKTPGYFNYPFITPSTASLEGFLFPDTYQVDKSASAKDIITIMLNNFKTKVYSQYNSGNNGLSFYQNMILASILEREAKTTDDKKIIAGILIKRLNQGMVLGVDSTIQYYLGYSSKENTWWRQAIYQSDLDNDNPYNTRLNTGFPPTPICNFGIDSINAAKNPIATTYFYYISDKLGNIHYATNSAGQDANIQKYLE